MNNEQAGEVIEKWSSEQEQGGIMYHINVISEILQGFQPIYDKEFIDPKANFDLETLKRISLDSTIRPSIKDTLTDEQRISREKKSEEAIELIIDNLGSELGIESSEETNNELSGGGVH